MKRLKTKLVTVFSAIILLAGVHGALAGIEVTDLKGRNVSLAGPAHRLVIDDGRMILALAFLSSDPVGLVAAWPHDVDRFGRELYARYRQKFPAIDALPKSASNVQDMDVEQILAAKPDAVILSVFSHPAEQQLSQLEQADIPVIFVDFVTDPFGNTDRSLEVLGKVTGHEDAAQKIVALRHSIKQTITEHLQSADKQPNPSVFLEAHASTQEGCCNSPGAAGLGTFLSFVEAQNIGEVLGKKPSGQLSAEYVIASKPDVYIATGGQYMRDRGGLRIGPDYKADETRASMQALLARPGFSSFADPASAHGLSQQLFNSPLDILALQLFAKWTHPDLFADLDVEATRARLNALMAVPLQDGYWTR